MKYLFAMLSLFFVLATKGGDDVCAYLLVVDQEDRPVANANMVLRGKIRDTAVISQKVNGKVLVRTDQKGRVEIGLEPGGSCRLDNSLSIWKEGYRFEKYLNPAWDDVISWQASRSNPRKFVLRKLEDEKCCQLNPVGYKDETVWKGEGLVFWFNKKNERTRCDIDLFRTQSEAKPERCHLRYTDFSVEPHYDSVSKQWSMTLTTTNSGCGIIATTNRVFRAPDTGYSQHVHVGPEVYKHRAFTLYLKTRTPRVYAMIAFEPWDIVGTSGNWEGPSFEFGFLNLLINPTGGRTFEEDATLDEPVSGGSVADTIRSDALHDFLFEHRYPRKPDISARVRNRKTKKSLDDERIQLEETIRTLEAKIDKMKSQMKVSHSDPAKKSTMSLQKERDGCKERLQELCREGRRLNEEVHTLFLSEKVRR